MDSDLMRWVKAQADDPNANPRFRELYAALEAAREDAERYRHIRRKESSGGSADLCIFRVRWAKSGVKTPEPDYDLLVECEADAAIDQARGKGVAGA